jgi:aldose 1-epimerase
MKSIVAAASLAALLALTGFRAQAEPRYSIKHIGDVMQLRDAATDTEVSVLLPVSNAYEMVVKGHDTIRMTIKSVDALRQAPGLNGVPLLAPFANRLDEDAFYANGKKYSFDMGLGNVRGAIPIHGYLSSTNEWKLVSAKANAKGAWVTSKLDFYRDPDYMKQFPFAHTLTMTYRLSNGALEVHLRLDNLSAQPMPVAIGFHPYFALSEGNRNDWSLDVGARTHWLLNPDKIPTGQTEPADAFFGGDRHDVPLSRFADRDIDDIFTDIDRDARGVGGITLKGAHEQLTVSVGPKFKTMLVYSTKLPDPNAPPRPPQVRPPASPVVAYDGPAIALTASRPDPDPAARGFVALESMAGVTDSMNLAQKGLYKDLQSIPPGGSWEDSFWITPKGY